MKCVYKRLALSEREEISRGIACKQSFRAIARLLNRSPSTISREVKGRMLKRSNYRATRGEWQSSHRRSLKQGRKHKLKVNIKLREYVFKKLLLRWSPVQIVERLKMEYPTDMNMRISHETIYAHLFVLPIGQLRKTMLSCLRQQRKFRCRKTRSPGDMRGRLPDMTSIDERPKEATDRVVPGHWEGDLIMGYRMKTALGTLVERTTRTTILVPIANTNKATVRLACARAFKQLPKHLKRTLTYDQGKEMSEHKLFTKQTKIKVYFAHPHCPWERGTNENTNGLIRQFFPKGINFNEVTLQEIKHVQDLLNNRPRKTLNWQTPNEVFIKLLR